MGLMRLVTQDTLVSAMPTNCPISPIPVQQNDVMLKGFELYTVMGIEHDVYHHLGVALVDGLIGSSVNS